MRTEMLQSYRTPEEPHCDNPGCIILYKGKHCIFCDAAIEILYNTLKLYSLSHEVIHEIDIDASDSVYADDVIGLPTIRICKELITGLPDEHQIGTALVRAFMNGCFDERV